MKRLRSATSFLVVGAYCLAQTSLPTPPEPAANTDVRQVTFENAHILSPQQQEEITKLLKQEREDIHPSDPPGWAEEAKERVRGAYLDRGYFRVEVEATATPVTDLAGGQLDIAVKVLNEGPQYRLRDLHCSGMTVFSEAQLLAVMPLHAGEIFSRSKVAEGLDAMRKLYDSRGYINFTSVPDAQIDDDARSISLSVDVDEGKQFRMGHLEILGADTNSSARLLQAWVLEPGEIYRQFAVRQFFQGIHLVPPGEPGSMVVTKLDEGKGIVDIVLDLRKLEHSFTAPKEPTSASNR
jgi:outer membrane protein assembly factor BamA